MTTEAEDTQQRSIATLLALDTYQGMTDAEIDSVIEYKVGLAHMSEEANAYRVSAQANMDAVAQACADMVESTSKTLEQVLANVQPVSQPTLTTV